MTALQSDSTTKPWWQRVNKLFLLFVVIPTLVSSLYFGLIASDVYISQSRFVIYNPQNPASSGGGLSTLLQGAGLSSSSYGVYAAHDYILSRDALTELQRTLGYRRMVSNPDIDVFNRFGGWVWYDTSFENLFKYYSHMVGDEVDTTSNISTLTARAYTAKDAQAINSELLRLAQQLVVRLNARANEDAVRFYKQQVADAEAKVQTTALALSRYRNTSKVFSPEPQANLQAQLVSKLQDQLIARQVELGQLQMASPSNPRVPLLKKGIAEIEQQIRKQTGAIVGAPSSLASKSVDFEKLTLQKTFAEKDLAAAIASLEQARIQAQKQQLFIETVVTPNLPDEALEPRRLRGVLATLVVGLLLWGVFSVIFAGIREHHDR